MIKKLTAITLALITVFAMMSISMTSASAATKVIEISKFPAIYYGEKLDNSNLNAIYNNIKITATNIASKQFINNSLDAVAPIL